MLLPVPSAPSVAPAPSAPLVPPVPPAPAAPARWRRAARPVIAPLALAVALVGGLGACGGDDGATAAPAASTASGAGSGAADARAAVEVPAGATFCSVFLDRYRPAIDAAVAFGQPGWEESVQELVEIARVLEAVAPEELRDAAAENVAYHRAQAEQRSASAHVAGSNELSGYGFQNC
ncbi:MAG: hypothetical protein R2755_05615 [Acidimicrobiales bacterium]